MLPNYQAGSPFVLKHTTSMYICVYGRYVYMCVWKVRMLLKRVRGKLLPPKNLAF